MTKGEAIRIISGEVLGTTEQTNEAVAMAVEALSAQSQQVTGKLDSDCISRQAAIDAVLELDVSNRVSWKDAVIDTLDTLPSAQPEVIRCTECKHYREYDSEYVENAVVVQCMADRYPISETIPDGWFCAGAERRTDE